MTQQPPTPSGLPLVGHTLAFARDPFGVVDDLVSTHGDVVGLDVLGFDELYVLAHPDHFERALLTDRESFVKGGEFESAFGTAVIAAEGSDWREQRDLLSPFFYRDRIGEYGDAMVVQIERRVARWEPGERRSLRESMQHLTLDVIFATVLGRELEVEGDDRLRRAADGLNGRFAPTSWVLPEWVPTPNRRRFARSVAVLGDEVMRLLETSAPDGDATDLVSALAGRSDGAGYPRSDDEIRDQLIGMVFAGHETTALALTFTWYLLATHPRVRERFHAELDAVLDGDAPSMADVPALEYTDAVLRESLRLYPPVHTIPRETAREVEVGGYRLPAGADVHLSTVQVHRDERFYDDPGAFRPERWTGDGESSLPRFAYVPFGSGPRRCLGQQFATVEAKLVLATIGRRFRLEWLGDGDLEVSPQMTTRPVGPVPVRLHER